MIGAVSQGKAGVFMAQSEPKTSELKANGSQDNGSQAMVSRFGLIALGLALALAVSVIALRSLPDEEPALVPGDAAGAPLSIGELEQQARDNPQDVAAQQELGFARFERQEFAEAVAAYERAVALDDSNAVMWSSLGEARVMASQRDPLPKAALDAFEKALERDPDDPRARYFMAVKKDLSGDHEGAISDWLALLEETPPGAPWEEDLSRTIEQVGTIRTIDVSARLANAQDARQAAFAQPDAGPAAGANVQPAASADVQPALTAGAAIPGPSDEEIAAARTMAPSDQRAMAEGMVERLETRLGSEANDVDGWVMLMRSRMALGQADAARQALADAKTANPAEVERLNAEAELLGVR
jgi:cytochrome c-type biogenesis protein CcmH